VSYSINIVINYVKMFVLGYGSYQYHAGLNARMLFGMNQILKYMSVVCLKIALQNCNCQRGENNPIWVIFCLHL